MRSSLLLAAIALATSTTLADDPKAPTPRQAIDRGLDFIVKDAAKWRKEKTCATCHHGTMTVWALAEAKSRGIAIDKDVYADTVKWTSERFFANLDKPRDKRPGWSMLSTPTLYLGVMSITTKDQDAVPVAEQKRIVGHLLRHQEADGSWAWSSAPALNRPPPVFESDEVATLLGMSVLTPHVPADPKEKSDVRDSREKASAWLAKEKPTDTTQALTFRLFREVGAGKPAKDLKPGIDDLLARQNKDGGWGQLKDAASDAYATGQVLYFLSVAGVKPEREEIQRAVAFLVKTQKPDGSWPMTRRGHPGVMPGAYVVPIIYFGSAWGTLGLMRSVPK